MQFIFLNGQIRHGAQSCEKYLYPMIIVIKLLQDLNFGCNENFQCISDVAILLFAVSRMRKMTTFSHVVNPL